VAHIEANSGLVEAGVGLIPGWGGCKELILRSKNERELVDAFAAIVKGKISSSVYDLEELLKFERVHLVMNIDRVLGDGKKLCAKDEAIKDKIRPEITVNWSEILEDMKLTGHDLYIAQELIELFSLEPNEELLLAKEREIFIRLLGHPRTQERIKYMLESGKRLIN
jgi:3-hydroxyacyl-CoA dehydrogenase